MSPRAEQPPYLIFDRSEWSALRSATPLTLSESDLDNLRGLNEPIELSEVEDVFLPLTRLLNLHVAAARNLGRVKDAFLGQPAGAPPYIIALAGSVSIGKSTIARVLRHLLARWPDHPRVELVTTDGFLHPNRILEERGLMSRKGFPESYDMRRMVDFLTAIKSGDAIVEAPAYSHMTYDIMAGERQLIQQPDVLIFEGLNVLQAPPGSTTIVSDFFDFSIYVDADETNIEAWYIERFLILQQTAFTNPTSFFRHFKDLPRDKAIEIARSIWRDINLANLHENIAPTRTRADIILHKRADHAFDEIWLRRM